MNAESRSMRLFTSRRTVLFGDCDPGGAIYTPRACHLVVESILEFQSWLLGGSAARAIFEMGACRRRRPSVLSFFRLSPGTKSSSCRSLAVHSGRHPSPAMWHHGGLIANSPFEPVSRRSLSRQAAIGRSLSRWPCESPLRDRWAKRSRSAQGHRLRREIETNQFGRPRPALDPE